MTPRAVNVEELRASLFLIPSEVSTLLRVGDNKGYALLKDPACPFPVVRSGRRILIPSRQFFAWYDNL